MWQARRVVKAFAPDAVIGVGGYASGPVVLAARLRGIPTAICEQNSIPGLTNKLLGRLVARVFLSFDESRAVLQADEDRDERQPGAPRARAEAARRRPPRAATVTVHVLVCGGSQGAVAVNELASRRR